MLYPLNLRNLIGLETRSFRNVLIFVGLLAASPTVAAEILLTKDKLTSIGALGWIAPDMQVPVVDSTLPLVNPEEKNPAAALLRRYRAMGKAGGFDGIIYDNRDRGHSRLPQSLFPQLAHLAYDAELRERGLDYGLAGRIILPSIVFGNSSTALTRKSFNRSQARFAMTSPGGPERAFLTYSNNHIYIYPEHRDLDQADL